MQIVEHLTAAIDTVTHRTLEKARNLRVDGRLPPLERIAVREKQLGNLIDEVPAALLGGVRGAVKASGADPANVPLEPFQAQLLSGFDALCKRMLQLPAPQLGKLTMQQAGPMNESRTRLKRQARDSRTNLQQRLQSHAAKLRDLAEQRRAGLRLAHENQRKAERAANARARLIWIVMLLVILAAMAWVALRR